MNDLETPLRESLRDGRLPCALAFHVAKETGASPAEVGAEANRLEIRISLCHLGLFGYQAFGQKGLLQRFEEIPEELTVALKAAAEGETIPCAILWQVAEERGLPRLAVACAAETLGLRVTPCQLGCF